MLLQGDVGDDTTELQLIVPLYNPLPCNCWELCPVTSAPLLWRETDACWMLPVTLAELLGGSEAADRAWGELMEHGVNETGLPKSVFNMSALIDWAFNTRAGVATNDSSGLEILIEGQLLWAAQVLLCSSAC